MTRREKKYEGSKGLAMLKDYAPDESYSELIENSPILEKAQKLVDGRDKQEHYGPPEESMRRIAMIWSGILGVDVSAERVALMMLGLKAARLSIDPKHEDSLIDAGGYIRILERLKAAA
jgi:hypothetical protein